MNNDFDVLWAKIRPQLKGASDPLHDAINYSLGAGGKRLRPQLAWAACQALGGDPRLADRPALAVEMIHCYSLIHDDLPAMDDDDIRRGQPACHIAYGEAGAILAGDALNTLAFQVLADPELPLMPIPSLAHAVTVLARCAGGQGMVDGQSLDLLAEGGQMDLSDLEQIHARKTGAMIRASVELGALAGQADPMQMTHLIAFAETLGLAFQVQDDVLDVTGSTETLGKPSGSDKAQDKQTFVDLLGLEGCQDFVDELLARARGCLETLPNPHHLLAIVDKLTARQS